LFFARFSDSTFNIARINADATLDMTGWLKNLHDRVLGESAPQAAARIRLEEAQRVRSRVDLTLLTPDGSPGDDRHSAVTIEQVRENDIIISQPMINGSKLPLTTNEHVLLTIVTPGGTALTGQSKCLGRFKTASGGEGIFYGYLMELPQALFADERRTEERRRIPVECSPQAQLRTLDGAVPIHGVIENISTGGLRLRCRNAGDKLQRDQIAYVDFELPEATGPFSSPVRICDVSLLAEGDEARRVSVAFDQPQPALMEYMELIDRCRRTACAI
jgi:hypothetical protein